MCCGGCCPPPPPPPPPKSEALLAIEAEQPPEGLKRIENLKWKREHNKRVMEAVELAVGETVILLHPTLPLLGVLIGVWRGCQPMTV